ncbi:MAG: hypothetical protein F6K47_06305 [Symploca sp. SIO2E6]|nr:hypothetical protein [Symploca sp. SIO2E6]
MKGIGNWELGIGNWEFRTFVGAGLGSQLMHVYDNFGTKPAQWSPLTQFTIIVLLVLDWLG